MEKPGARKPLDSVEGLKIRIKVTVTESGIILKDLRCVYASTRDKVIN